MRQGQRCQFFGYVKVDLQSRSPKRWSWTIHRDTGDSVVLRSESLFACAEDAWRAGRKALSAMEAGMEVERARRLETVND